MKAFAALVATVVVVALICSGVYIRHRNQMVALNEQVKSNWSEVDVNLQRRADLIPNLVETVKGYAAHEQTVFDDVAKARAALAGAQTPQSKIAANHQLDGALSRLLLVVENYPQLKANENFLRLQDELAGTENRIAVARMRYNNALQAYNTYIGLFPNYIIARRAGFQRNEAYFQAAPAAEQAPKVSFPHAAR